MKNFLILNFTEILFELTASGLSLRKALLIMEENFGSAKQDKKISAICRFVGNSLDDGNEFSLALASCSFFNFPEWYVAFVSVTERTGSIVPTLDYLTDVIRRRKINMEKFLSSLVYPVFVVIFSTIVGIFAIYSFDSVIFEKTELEIQNNAAIDSVFFSFVFLITSFSGFIFFMKKNLKESPCASLFRAFAFLVQAKIPILQSIEAVFLTVDKSKKLTEMLFIAQEKILSGEKVSASFGEALQKQGFHAEGRILQMNLSMAENSGNGRGFFKTADFFEKKQKKKQEFFLSIQQPIMFFIVGLYMVFLLKNTILPYIVNFGGVI